MLIENIFDGEDAVNVREKLNNVIGLINKLNIPVLTTYPSLDESKAGQRFIYLGNEWHYMTQEEIDASGWTSMVSVGFPAPVRKIYDNSVLYLTNTPILSMDGRFGILTGNASAYASDNVVVDFLGLGNPIKYRLLNLTFSYETTFTDFLNAKLLINLEDAGTGIALKIIQNNLSDTVINKLFTDLPPTIKTCTIDVQYNSGSATCDPSIATAKGYTVIT